MNPAFLLYSCRHGKYSVKNVVVKHSSHYVLCMYSACTVVSGGQIRPETLSFFRDWKMLHSCLRRRKPTKYTDIKTRVHTNEAEG